MDRAKLEIEKLKGEALYRELKLARVDGSRVFIDGKAHINLASNDYLSMAGNLDFQREFLRGLKESGEYLMGSTSSRLLVGNFAAYEKAESEIGSAFGRSCLFYNSGYHANTGIIPALAGSKDLILADKLVHASIIDALSLTKAKWLRYAHNDMRHLRELLEKNRRDYERVFIVSEGVFSMDGDRADLGELIEIKKQYGALLYIDEAHSFGLFGERGLGLCFERDSGRDVDFIMCTLGKALGSEGAFVICDEVWRNLLVNKSRPLIFTTALAPINVMWTLFSFRKMLDMRAEREHLRNMGVRFREALSGFEILGDTQIIPLVLGEPGRALSFLKRLAEANIWASAVRPPTVPRKSSRIRLSLCAGLSEDDIDYCSNAVLRILKSL